MRKMLLSFRPDVYEKIKSGVKIFEHRRNFPDEPIMAYMYVSSPVKAITGVVYLGKRHCLSDWMEDYKEDGNAVTRIKEYIEKYYYRYAMEIDRFVLFVKAILFGGIEEIGWRYTFQPIIEQQHNYVFSTCVTFVFWGIWHFLYFYIEGSIQFVQVGSFLLGLLINCFILSALYYKTKSLWICVMTHALINTLSQISVGGNLMVSMICKVIIICIAIFISRGVCINNEKRN